LENIKIIQYEKLIDGLSPVLVYLMELRVACRSAMYVDWPPNMLGEISE
jgi:hypothetical protein